MIGSSIYSFEGVGVVLPIMDVCEDQSKFPKILLAVMVTNVFLYTVFGEYCLFVYGNELSDFPLITSNLPEITIVYILKAIFCVNVIISISLCAFTGHTISENYAFSKIKAGPLKTWLINIQRTLILGIAVIACIALDKSLDKFNSLVGTVAATPVAFMIPCILHMKLCQPSKMQKILDITVIIFSIFVMSFCTGYTLWTWKRKA